MKLREIGINLSDPHGCEHDWQPCSFVFETQLLDDHGRVSVRQPAIDDARVYIVCLLCAQYTYIETQWTGYKLEGMSCRGFRYKPSSSHKYSTDDGKTWQPERPVPEFDE